MFKYRDIHQGPTTYSPFMYLTANLTADRSGTQASCPEPATLTLRCSVDPSSQIIKASPNSDNITQQKFRKRLVINVDDELDPEVPSQ